MATVDSEVERLYSLAVEPVHGPGARPTLLEALWDGDTQGWMLDLLLTVRGPEGTEQRSHLATLRYGSDLRLFSGAVPPWPEAAVAEQLGERLEREFGSRFWFPSPNEPDDDAPAYADRERGIACADCSKLIIPSDSPYLPKDVCYTCHLRRKERAKLLREPSDDNSMRGFCVAIENHPSSFSHWGGEVGDSPMAKLLEIVDPDHPPVSDHRLNANAVAAFAEAAAREVERLLATHDPEARDLHFPRWEVEWRGRSLQLELSMNEAHRRLSTAIELAKFGEEARASGRAIEVFTNIGVKCRLLGQLRLRGGTATRPELHRRHAASFGSSEAVDAAIKRLEATDCIRRSGDNISITRKGELLGNSPEERG